jgi:hypothetical protein
MSIAQTPTEIRSITGILGRKFSEKGRYEITSKDILDNFSAPSFSLCLNLLKAYVNENRDTMIQIFMEIWMTGISYEDFLHDMNSSIHMLGIHTAKTAQRIHQLLLRGWIYFAQGKTHALDMMRLFVDGDAV